MNRFFILLCLVFSVSSVHSQIVRIDTVKNTYKYNKSKNTGIYIKPEYNYSLGVKAFSYEQFPKLLNQTNSGNFTKSYLNGFTLRVNDNQFSYRLLGNFFNEDVSFRNECEDCEEASGKLTDYMIKTGFEKNLTNTTLQPYIGFDIGYRYNQFKGLSVNAGAVPFLPEPYNVDVRKNSIVAGPVLGIKLHIINHVSITAESAFDLLYSFERRELNRQDAARTQETQRYKRWELLARPVAVLSLQYNFVLAN